MSFKVTWTRPTGSEHMEVATAAEALAEYITRPVDAINVVIKDNHGRRVKPDDLAALAMMSAKDD